MPVRGGDKSLQWILEEAAAGEVFAAGHAEHGNDIPGLLSTTKAEKVERRLQVHRPQIVRQPDARCGRGSACTAMDTSDPKARRSSTASCRATRKGYTIKDTWDVMGMRATRSDDTVLEGAFVPDKYIARVVPAGAAGADNFVVGFFTWALDGLREHLLRPLDCACARCSSSS